MYMMQKDCPLPMANHAAQRCNLENKLDICELASRSRCLRSATKIAFCFRQWQQGGRKVLDTSCPLSQQHRGAYSHAGLRGPQANGGATEEDEARRGAEEEDRPSVEHLRRADFASPPSDCA